MQSSEEMKHIRDYSMSPSVDNFNRSGAKSWWFSVHPEVT